MDEAESWPDEGGFHREYPLILAGAHRRRLTPLGAPALVRHLAFWNATPPDIPEEDDAPKQDPNRPTGEDPKQVRLRALAADRCIAEIYRRLLERQATAEGATVSGLEVPDAVCNWAVLFAGIIDRETAVPGSPGEENILTDSYRAIKIHFLWHGIETRLSFELHSEYVTLTAFLDMSKGTPKQEEQDSEIFRRICQTLEEVCDSPQVAASDSAHVWRDHLYDWIWNEFSTDILNCLGSDRLLGEAFVDFRGLVVRPRAQRRFMLPLRATRRQGGPTANTESRCCPTHLARIWPLIDSFGDDSTEFTVSWFLERRAIYATALGSQASLLTETPPKPLHYFLYEDTLSNWQLGRLIYRIHRAGTARLAALMHFGKLRTAHQILGEIETTLEEEVVRLFELNDPDTLKDDLRRVYGTIDTRLAEISDLGLETSLESRVERSRYYVSQFRATVKSLRVERVEGFQTYEEFVEQRLTPMFDYIDRLGRKAARIQQDRLLISNRIQSLDTLHETHLISIAQRLADIALSCILGPYYAAYIISHAASGLLPDRAVWIGAVIFGAIMLKAILWRDEANAITREAKQDARDLGDSPPAALPAWQLKLLDFVNRRLRLFITTGIAALVLGAGVHHTLSAVGLKPADDKKAATHAPQPAPSPETNARPSPRRAQSPPPATASPPSPGAAPNAGPARPAPRPPVPAPRPAPADRSREP